MGFYKVAYLNQEVVKKNLFKRTHAFFTFTFQGECWIFIFNRVFSDPFKKYVFRKKFTACAVSIFWGN